MLVEFGLVAPLLFLLLFGVIEFGWAFFQNLDVRHGAREGARLVAVNFRETAASAGAVQRAEIFGEFCGRMDDSGGATVTIEVPAGQGNPIGAVGQRARVTVEKDLDTMTGLLDQFLGGIELNSDVDIRIEQAATWTTDSNPYGFTCP